MTNYNEIGKRIIDEIASFDQQLRIDTQIRHTSTQAHGSIVEHYAKSIIDVEFQDTKIAMVDGVVQLIKELSAL